MIKKLKIVLVSISLLCFMPMNTYAATLNVVGGELMGASGVLVDGLLYSVEFKDGTCVALFGGCDSPGDFVFNTQSSATLASQALLDQVFIDGIQGLFDSRPWLTAGVESSTGQINTPFWWQTGLVGWVAAINSEPNNFVDQVFMVGAVSSALDTTIYTPTVYAVWHTQTVPEPEIFVLLAFGLAGLAVFARRLRRREERLTF